MKIYGVTSNGDEIKLHNLLTLNINIEEQVPADNFTATFASDINTELLYIKIYVEDKLFFYGVVDEQITVYVEKYTYTKFSVRSMSSLLLDNEALPQVYVNPDANTIFNRHIKKLGINNYISNKKLSNGIVEIEKGQSEWNVLYNFCRLCLNTYPEVSTYGTILMDGYTPTKTLEFGRNDKIPINYAHISKKQHKLISNVFVKNNYIDNYGYKLSNDFAINKGVVRQRYLNATDTTTYSVDTGIKMIDKCNKDYFSITIKTPIFLADCIGENAVLNINGKIYENMYISKITYNYSQGKENTTLLLKNKN